MNPITLFLKRKSGLTMSALLLALLVFTLFPHQGSAQTYSGPIVITKGGTYTGNWESRDTNIPAIEVNTDQPVVIVNSNIRGAGALVRSLGWRANITIRNTNGYGLTPTPWKDYKKARRFLGVDVFKNIVIENCYMESTAGIYIGQSYVGNGTTSETIKIRYNKAENIDGRVYGGKDFAQFVQFNFRNPIRHAEIAWNQIVNAPDKSAVEDNINMHNSRGTSDSPIRIHNNYIQGAFPVPSTIREYSGGGIITDGDGDINICPAYIEAYDNHLVGLGNYAMGIAGGNNIRYHHNKAINAATFADNSKYQTVNTALWSKDYYLKNTTFSNSVDNNTIAAVCWGYINNRYDISVAQGADFRNNNFLPNPITEQMEQDEFTLWGRKLQSNGIVLGPIGSGGSIAPANQPPTVAITSPKSNSSCAENGPLEITVSAQDADGSVAKVEFFQGTTKIGEEVASPFSFTWSTLTAGSYSLTAKATDKQGAATTSAAVSVSVSKAEPISPAPAPSDPTVGRITREFWAGVIGSTVKDIPVTKTPSSSSELSLFEAPVNSGDSYGQRIRGYVTAPVSGQYTFWIASDDAGELWLSTSEDASKKVKIASIYGWTYSRQWDKYASQQSVKVTLEAGKRYYIEALHLEMGGGDNLAVGWQLPNGTLERPIASGRLSPAGSAVPSAPAPAGKITREFWSGVKGSGVGAIPVTIAPSQSTELTSFEAPSNQGATYGQRIRGYVTAPVSGQYTFWIASDDAGELWLSTSEDASKKVKIASIYGWTYSRQWDKYASQQSVKVTLEAGKRYYIEALHLEVDGGDNLAVGWQLPNGTLERPINGNRLSPIESSATLVPAPTPVPVYTTGKITREFWAGVNGATVQDIPVSKAPSSSNELTLFEAPSNAGDSYGQRIRGYVTAPQSGEYTFWIAGDDRAELWLSTSEDQGRKVKIAYIAGTYSYTDSRQWGKYASQQSVKVTLEAGKRYYIEALHLEMVGGDNLAVGWQLPNGTLERPIAGNRLSPISDLLASSSNMLVSTTGGKENSFTQISTYPNPFSEVITLNMGDQQTRLQELVLLDQTGRIAYKQEDLALENNQLSVNLSGAGLASGLYFLKYTDATGISKSLKVIKR